MIVIDQWILVSITLAAMFVSYVVGRISGVWRTIRFFEERGVDVDKLIGTKQ